MTTVARRVRKVVPVSLIDLLNNYLLVCRCWQHHHIAVKENMSVERAITLLRDIRGYAYWRGQAGMKLSVRANRLLREIVTTTVSPDDIEIGSVASNAP